MSAIKFIKSSVAGKLIRPQGYAYPTGLNSRLINPSFSCNYLAVAGGGTGGNSDPGGEHGGGGGGGGGVLIGSTTVTTGTYPITVGAAGGSNTTGLSQTAIGGGYGGYGNYYGGASGGSGGGGGANYGGGSGTPGQGNSGGPGGLYVGGGGGGAGGGGAGGGVHGAHAGGVGVSYSISGTSTYYAGGGGGRENADYGYAVGPHGLGSGPNSGGGGQAWGAADGGIFIISYSGAQAATGGTVTPSGGNTIHTFTGDGSFIVSSTVLYSI
jgi:hypothetical protein